MKCPTCTNTACTPLLTLSTAVMFLVCGCVSVPSKLPDWMEPGVRKGADFLVKDAFIEDKRLGTVTDIAFGELDANPGLEVGVAGPRRALLASRNGELIRWVGFKKKRRIGDLFRTYRDFEIVDVENDGVCEFFSMASWTSACGLFDHEGNKIWSRGFMLNTSAYGDVDADGKLEFVLSRYKMLALVDSKGGVRWQRNDAPFHLVSLHVFDINRDGKAEIVGTEWDKITVMDAEGNMDRQTRSKIDGIFLGDASLVRYPTEHSRAYFFCVAKSSYLLVSLGGNAIIREFQGTGSSVRPIATPVRFDSDEEPYFAIFGMLPWQGSKTMGFEALHSVLFVFDPEQNLVYLEVIDDDARAIATAPSGKPNEEVLLVGGTGKVWRYRTATNNDPDS